MKLPPLAFAALLDAAGVPAGDAVVVVGVVVDRPRDDVWGAQHAGLRTVLLTGRAVHGFDVRPDAVLPDLSGQLDVVDAWQARGGGGPSG